MIGCLPTQALAFLAVFVYAMHAKQAIAFEWKPGLRTKETDIIAQYGSTWLGEDFCSLKNVQPTSSTGSV